MLSNLDNISKRGDNVKFISIFSTVSNAPEVKQLFKSYVRDGKFYRTTEFDKMFDKGNFSGDMFAGYAYGLLHLYLEDEIDEEFKEELIKAIDNSIFNKPFLQFKSNFKRLDRGYLLRWFFGNAGHYLPILSMLELAYKLTGKIKYKALYLIVFPFAFIDILVNPTFVIKIGKLRYMQWYYVHSNFFYYFVLHKLTRNPIYKYGLKFIFKRFPFNPDFCVLLDKNWDIVKLWIDDYPLQSKNNDPNEVANPVKVKNIKNIILGLFNKKKRQQIEYIEYDRILPARFRKNDYQWEKPLNEAEYIEGDILSGIDFLHIYRKYQDKVKEKK